MKNTKKFAGVLAAIMFVAMPLSSYAQTAPVLTQEEQIVELKAQLISLIEQLIALLQKQIELQNSINNSTPSPSPSPTPSPTPSPEPTPAPTPVENPQPEEEINISLIAKASGNVSGTFALATFRVTSNEDIEKSDVSYSIVVDGPSVGGTVANIPSVMAAGNDNRVSMSAAGFGPGSYTYTVGVSMTDVDGNTASLNNVSGAFIVE